MILNGKPITVADLGALAGAANGRNISKDITRLYFSGGVKYGYDNASGVAIDPAHRGTGYLVGDIVQGFGSSLLVQMEVTAVDAAGGILGMRYLQIFPQPPGGTPPSSPADLTSSFGGAMTSGTGAKATFNYGQTGPVANYSFPDYLPNLGQITAFILKAGGLNYQVGDLLQTGFTGFTATVATVDGAGQVLTIISPNFFNSIIVLPATLQEMPTTGGHGSGATLTALYTLPPKPAWLTEMGRLRTALAANLLAMKIDASKQAVSGPWPIAGASWSNHDQWFWFEDTGGTVTVTVSSAFGPAAESSGKATTEATYSDSSLNFTGSGAGLISGGLPLHQAVTLPKVSGAPTNYWSLYGFPPALPTASGNFYCLTGKTKELSFIVGGTQNVTLAGKFYVELGIDRGSTYFKHYHGPGDVPVTETTAPDGTDPMSLVAVTGNFPGTLSMKLITGPGIPEELWLQFDVNGVVLAPGRYSLVLTVDNGRHDSHDETWHEDMKLDTDPSSPTYNTMILDSSTFDYQITDVKHTRLFGLIGEGSSLGFLFGAATITYSGPDGTGHYTAVTSGGVTASIAYTAAVPADGIDGVHNLKKINLPDLALNDNAGSLPSGLYAVTDAYIDPPGAAAIVGGADQFFYLDAVSPGAAGPYSNTFARSIAHLYYPFPQPVYNVEIITAAGAWGASTSVPGFWTGITQAVSDVRAVTCDLMPWNIARTKNIGGSFAAGVYSENPMLLGNLNVDNIAASNSYDQTMPSEGQSELPRWKAATYFTLGFVITDAAGNGAFKCTGAGYSGASEPAWIFAVGTATGDSGSFPSGATHISVQWQCIRVNKGPNFVRSALHRARPIPRYPVYWQSETIARLKPPATSAESENTVWGCGSQWQNSQYRDSSNHLVTEPGWQSGNLAKGWWVYTVSLNRITNPPANMSGPGVVGAGATDTGAGAADTGAGGGSPAGTDNSATVNVTLGCIRNGTFVAFGTYSTGQTISVLWPVFTSDALVYQCSERVDVQAVAIGSGGNGVATGLGAVNHPIAAAFVNDTLKLLGFVQ